MAKATKTGMLFYIKNPHPSSESKAYIDIIQKGSVDGVFFRISYRVVIQDLLVKKLITDYRYINRNTGVSRCVEDDNYIILYEKYYQKCINLE